jgi:excisionase family DNA binding protein
MDRLIKQNLTGQTNLDWDLAGKQFLTIEEVANLLQVSNRTVYNLIYKGTLRACKITYHITLITKEDFFLMIKETTYCKRSVSPFAKRSRKTEKKMKEEKLNTENVSISRQEGKEKPKSKPSKRKLIPASNYKQSVRDTFIDAENAGGRPLYIGRDMPKVQLYLWAVLQPPYAVLHSMHQSQLHQVLSEIGGRQGDDRRNGTFGKRPFGTLVLLL